MQAYNKYQPQTTATASTASLVAQMVKNLPAKWETLVQSHGWEDPPGGGHGNPIQDSGLENALDRGAWQDIVHRVAKSQTWLSD